MWRFLTSMRLLPVPWSYLDSFKQDNQDSSIVTSIVMVTPLAFTVGFCRFLLFFQLGSSTNNLQLSALALCYSAAEYCAPVWSRLAHTSLVDVQLYSTMHLISGTLHVTPLPCLPVLANIEPPALRGNWSPLASACMENCHFSVLV